MGLRSQDMAIDMAVRFGHPLWFEAGIAKQRTPVSVGLAESRLFMKIHKVLFRKPRCETSQNVTAGSQEEIRCQ